MKADRLLATLLFLQARGHVTATDVAAEFEVSERTARRDLEALALAGVPVYAQRGRGGGWSLVGRARTDLTGLTAGEVRALFFAVGPVSAAAPELRMAVRKLIQALPATLRPDAEAASGTTPAWRAAGEPDAGGGLGWETVSTRVRSDVLPLVRALFEQRALVGRPAADGWAVVDVRGPSVEVVATQLAGLGGRVEIVAPPAARARFATLNAELTAGSGPGNGGFVNNVTEFSEAYSRASSTLRAARGS